MPIERLDVSAETKGGIALAGFGVALMALDAIVGDEGSDDLLRFGFGAGVAGAVLAATSLTSGSSAESPIESGTTSRGDVEFGLDAAGAVTLFTGDGGGDADPVISLNVPVQSARAGFFISPRVSIEPALGWNFVRVGGQTASNVAFGLRYLRHFREDLEGSRPYFGIGPAINAVGGSERRTWTQWLLHAELGAKTAVRDGLQIRAAVQYQHGFENDHFLASHALGFSLGFSVTT